MVRRSLRIVVALLVLAPWGHLHAQAPIQYLYDALGRLIAVIDVKGDTARYSYDAVGNLLSIQRYTSLQISIISYAPSSGSEGATVTISGTGFSTLPGQNIVWFHDAAASVVSATETTLIVIIPAGATTGLISVTSPAGSAISGSPFTVTVDDGSPTITSFTPTIGPPGTAIAINGANLGTRYLNNHATLNTSWLSVTGGSQTQLSASVPSQTMGGRIEVVTDRGRAVSGADFIVPPAPYTAADVIAADRMTMGTDTVVSIGTGGKIGLVLFDGVRGRRVSVRVVNSTIAAAHLTIYRPDGIVWYASGAVGASGTFVEPQTLPSTGSYTVLVDPDSIFTGSLTLSLRDVVDVGGPIVADGAGLPVSIATPGQNVRLTFSGAAGQVVTARVTNGTFPSYCFDMSLSILKADGTSLRSTNSCSGSGAFLDQVTLPTSGTYTLFMNPDAALTGGATLALYTAADLIGSILADGTPVPVAITTPGQNARLTFSGVAGQIVTARLANGTFSSYCWDFSFSVVTADGATLRTINSCSGSNAFLDQLTLPVTGTYTLLLNPDAALTGSATLALYTAADLIGPILADGTPVPLAITTPGQNARLTFSGVAGQIVTARLANGTFSSYCWDFSLSIVAADGATLRTINSCSGSNAFLDQLTLPVTGTYTLLLNPDAVLTGSATLALYTAADLIGPILADGTPVPLAITTPGQNARLTFSGVAGQIVTARLANGTFSSYCWDFSLSIVKPDGTTLATANSCSGSTATLSQKTLPTNGVYTLLINPDAALIGSATLTLTSP
jgi:YD repeat-containing protein